MRITQAAPEFRPITIVLETIDDYDKMMAILLAVADNKIHHPPQIIEAAREISETLLEPQ